VRVRGVCVCGGGGGGGGALNGQAQRTNPTPTHTHLVQERRGDAIYDLTSHIHLPADGRAAQQVGDHKEGTPEPDGDTPPSHAHDVASRQRRKAAWGAGRQGVLA
jgi:hypothetical protein